MLFINTAIALTFLPSILSAPASSAGTLARDDLEGGFSNDFMTPMEREDELNDDYEFGQTNANYKHRMHEASGADGDDNAFMYSGIRDFDQEEKTFADRRIKEANIDYTVMVKTGDKWVSGTDSKFFITIGDANGSTVSTYLSKSGWFDQKTKRHHSGAFKFSTTLKLDEICVITIGNDMKEWLPSWYLESVTVKRGLESWDFPVKKWINRKNGENGRAVVTVNNCAINPFAMDVSDKKTSLFERSKFEITSSAPIFNFAPKMHDVDDLNYEDEEINYDEIDDNIDLPHPTKDIVASTPCTKSVLPTPLPEVSTPCTKSVLPTPLPEVSTPCTKSVLPTPVSEVSTPCTKSVLPTPLPEVSTPCTKSVLPTPLPEVSTPCTKSANPTPVPESYGPILPMTPEDEDDYSFGPEDFPEYGLPETPLPDYGYGPAHTLLPDYPEDISEYGPIPTGLPSVIPDDIFPATGSYETPVPAPRPKRKCRQKPTLTGYGTPLPPVGYRTPSSQNGYGLPQSLVPTVKNIGSDISGVDDTNDLIFGDIDDEIDMEDKEEIGKSKLTDYKFPLRK